MEKKEEKKSNNMPKILASVAVVCGAVALYLIFGTEKTPEPAPVPVVVEEVIEAPKPAPAPAPAPKHDPYSPQEGKLYLVVHTFYEPGFYKYELERMLDRGEKPFTYHSRGRDFLMFESPNQDRYSKEAVEMQLKHEGSWFTTYSK